MYNGSHGCDGERLQQSSSDAETVERGRQLYRQHCLVCHDPESRELAAGHGHKEILQREELPVSGRPATPENVVRVLRQPYDAMPSFAWLTDEQVEDLLAYLNTI